MQNGSEPGRLGPNLLADGFGQCAFTPTDLSRELHSGPISKWAWLHTPMCAIVLVIDTVLRTDRLEQF